MFQPMHGVPPDFEPRTQHESAFLEIVLAGVESLDVWPRELVDGTPWLLLSVDLPIGGPGIQAVPRLDFLGDSIAGAYSPAYLNGDSELTAAEAGIDISGADGIALSGSPDVLAAAAVVWFSDRIRHWRRECSL